MVAVRLVVTPVSREFSFKKRGIQVDPPGCRNRLIGVDCRKGAVCANKNLVSSRPVISSHSKGQIFSDVDCDPVTGKCRSKAINIFIYGDTIIPPVESLTIGY